MKAVTLSPMTPAMSSAPKMPIRLIRLCSESLMVRSILLALSVSLLSCQKKVEEITVTEQRELTLFDRITAGNLIDEPPLSWRRLPGTDFRILNYLGGQDEAVEIFLGTSGGGVLENANRWLGQFGHEQIADLSALTPQTVLSRRAYLLEAKGEYASGMGQGKKENQALFGALIPFSDSILTVKLVGPADAVEPMRQEFVDYCKSLKLDDVNRMKKAESGDSE